MSWQIISQIILFGLALSMDAFAVSITDGLVYKDINKRKSFFIAGIFGLLQGLMPLVGFWLIELVTFIVGSQAGEDAGYGLALAVTWISFALLIFIGGKMIVEAIVYLQKPKDQQKDKLFSLKEVILMGFATSIDALAVGVSLHGGSLSNNATIWLHASLIIVITFVISLIGLFLGNKIVKLFKGKIQISSIIGGSILILLAIWIVVSHYCGF